MTFFQGFQNPGDFLNQKNPSESMGGREVRGRERGVLFILLILFEFQWIQHGSVQKFKT